MIVDAHVHIGHVPILDTPEVNIESALIRADKNGVNKLFCTSVLSLHYDFEEGDKIIYESMKKYPERVFGYITITSPRHGKRLLEHINRCYYEYGFHGLKIYSHPKGIGSFDSWLSITDEYMYSIFELASDWKIPILAHSTPQECDEVCSKFPEIRLIMAHMGGTQIASGDWHKAIMTAKKHKNLYLDTTSSGMDYGMVEEAVKKIGAERIVWGSDLAYLGMEYELEKIKSSDIKDYEKELILGKNILRLIDNSRP